MKVKWFLNLLIMLLMVLSMVGCGSDDENGESGESNFPEGTVTVNLNNEFVNCIRWESPNDLKGYINTSIVSLGKKRGLNDIDINNIPENGWSQKIACGPGCAYIVRLYSEYGTISSFYSGVYVIENLQNTNGSIVGAKIQYCKFTPGKGWNQ